MYILKATPETVRWGNFDKSKEPVLTIRSGDIVSMELLSHRAGDAPDLMMDEGVKEIYQQVKQRTPGCHIITGPIAIEGCKQGDVLECKVLDLQPRLAYGSNFMIGKGLLHEEFKNEQQVVIYKADTNTGRAKADFMFPYDNKLVGPGAVMEPGLYPRKPALANVQVPLRFHIGVAGVAPDQQGGVNTGLPGIYGGNIDNRNFIVGTSMYYPVQVDKGFFMAGDPHFAQGDGEINGTAIEGHLNAVLQLSIKKNLKINNPVLETPTCWIVHALHSDLNEATRLAALEAVHFLESNQGLSRPEAYSLLSVAGDFAITQAVNQLKGVHVSISKDLFPDKG